MSPSTTGNSYQQPSSSTSSYNAIRFLISEMLSRVRTITPVQVMAVTTQGQVGPAGFCDCQPLINMRDGQGNVQKHGTIFNLAYFRYQAGNNAIIMDPQVNDVGIALICDRDISSLKAATSNNGPVNPPTARCFDFADGIYLGGILGLAGDPTQYVQFNEQGMTLADVNGNQVIMNNLGIRLNAFNGNVIVNNLLISGEILGSDGSAYTGNIHTTGTITGDTDVIAAGHSGANHKHGGVQTGGGQTGGPVG